MDLMDEECDLSEEVVPLVSEEMLVMVRVVGALLVRKVELRRRKLSRTRLKKDLRSRTQTQNA